MESSLLFVLILCKSASSVIVERMWLPTAVNVTSLQTLSHLDFAGVSEIECAGQTQARNLTRLYCYRDRRCLVMLSSLDLIDRNETPMWSCKYSKANDAEISTTETTQEKTTFPSTTITKTVEETEVPPTATTSRETTVKAATVDETTPKATAMESTTVSTTVSAWSCCPSSSVVAGEGCITEKISPAMSFSEAQEFCQSLGADLYSAKTKSNFASLQSYLAGKYSDTLNFWTLAAQTNGKFKWQGKSTRAVNAQECASDFPRDATHGCAYASSAEDYLLVDANCEDKAQALCLFGSLDNC